MFLTKSKLDISCKYSEWFLGGCFVKSNASESLWFAKMMLLTKEKFCFKFTKSKVIEISDYSPTSTLVCVQYLSKSMSSFTGNKITCKLVKLKIWIMHNVNFQDKIYF